MSEECYDHYQRSLRSPAKRSKKNYVIQTEGSFTPQCRLLCQTRFLIPNTCAAGHVACSWEVSEQSELGDTVGDFWSHWFYCGILRISVWVWIVSPPRSTSRVESTSDGGLLRQELFVFPPSKALITIISLIVKPPRTICLVREISTKIQKARLFASPDWAYGYTSSSPPGNSCLTTTRREHSDLQT